MFKRKLKLSLSYFCAPLYKFTSIYITQEGDLPILSEPLPLKMFKAHSNSNYIVDDLKMGHPTQMIKTLLCNVPLEETRTACTNISARSTSLKKDGTHL